MLVKGRKSILRNADSSFQLYVYVIHTNIQLFVAISNQSTTPKNWGSPEQEWYRTFTRPFSFPNIKEKSGLATPD